MKIHLGGNTYAEFCDNSTVILTTEEEGEEPTNTIALESRMFYELGKAHAAIWLAEHPRS